MTSTNITIEQLAEKLNGKLWEKGELKRIYLDRGHNTKKMSTKTYIFEKEGQFIVSCNIDCPSQPWQWVKSQEQEVKDSVMEEIDHALTILSLELVDVTVSAEGDEVVVLVSEGGKEPKWFNEESFYDTFREDIQDVFELPDNAKQAFEKRAAALEEMRVKEVEEKNQTAEKQYEVGERVLHGRFGEGEITEEDASTISIKFLNGEVKKMVKAFTVLERL